MFLRRLTLLAAFTVIALIAWPGIHSRALLNQAQLERIRGREETGLFGSVLSSGYADDHARWQVGESQLRHQDYRSAAQTLLPLRDTMRDNPQAMSRLVEAMAFSGATEESIKLYESLNRSPALAPNTAALLWLDSHATLTCSKGSLDCRLLSIAIGHPEDSPEFSWLLQKLEDDETHIGSLKHSLMDFLGWRALAINQEDQHEASLFQRPPVTNTATQKNGLPGALGPELLLNGSFSERSKSGIPVGWFPSYMSSGQPWNHGLFIVGPDATSIRIDGIEVEQKKELESARAGLWYQLPITIPPNTGYVFSFKYKTLDLPTPIHGATFWLSYANGATLAGDQKLEPTNGNWRTVQLVDWNKSNQAVRVQPLLRLFGLGTVWFDDVSLRLLNPDQSVESMHTQVTQTTE